MGNTIFPVYLTPNALSWILEALDEYITAHDPEDRDQNLSKLYEQLYRVAHPIQPQVQPQ